MMNDNEYFKMNELFPSLFERIGEAFPELHFKRKGNRWESQHHFRDGKKDSKGNVVTYVYRNSFFMMIDHARDEKIGLIDYEILRGSGDYWSALTRLCDLCHITPPNDPEWEERLRRKEERENANRVFTSSLWADTPDAKKVLDYLHSRRWNDEEIRRAELGLITTEIRKSLPDGDHYKGVVKNKEDKIVGGIGTTHVLTIPYRNGSRLFGFKVREVGSNTGTKYLNTYGLRKSEGLFAVTSSEEVVVVEGELDALHANVKGAIAVDEGRIDEALSVVATTGGAVSESQVRDLVKRGVKKVTLLFDNDEAGKTFALSSIYNLTREGLDVYVARIPEGYKDTDEYLADHTIEEFNAAIAQVDPSYIYEYTTIRDRYVDLASKQEGILYPKQREDFLNEVVRLVNAPQMKPYNREFVYAYLKDQSTAMLIDYEGFRSYADQEYLRQEKQVRDAAFKKASDEAQAAIKDGNVDEAVRLMSDAVRKAGETDKATKFSRVFAPQTPEQILSFLSEAKEGLLTGYTFRQKGREEKLTLNAGLTFICGYRGHGKTSFLNNIALMEARRNFTLGNGRKVLYFSFEVDKRRLIGDLICLYNNDPDLSGNPSDTIYNSFRVGGKYFKNRVRKEDGLTHYQHFEQKRNEFVRNYLSSGYLTIVDESYKVGELLEAIKFYTSTNDVALVCIDYAQCLEAEGYTRQRTEEIKRVSIDLKDFANKEGIPFLLAAQFNREVDSPVSVDTKNIGEGGDFERLADTCIGLFNLKELHPLPKNKEEEKSTKKLLSDLGVHTYDKDEELLPIENRIFARLMKRRYGYYPLDVVLEWEGRTKLIKPNNVEEFEDSMRPKQGTIPLDEDQGNEVAPF